MRVKKVVTSTESDDIVPKKTKKIIKVAEEKRTSKQSAVVKKKKVAYVEEVVEEEVEEVEEEEVEEVDEEVEEEEEADEDTPKKAKKVSKKVKKDLEEETDINIPDVVDRSSCVIYCATRKITQFKGIFDTLKDALTKFPMKFTRQPDDEVYDENNPGPGGIIISTCDTGTNSVIKQRIWSFAFDVFYVDPDLRDKDNNPTNEYNIWVDAKDFSTKIKQASNNDVLIWYIDKNALSEIVFTFYNLERQLTNVRRQPLLGLDMAIPRIKFSSSDCCVTILSKDFQKYIKDSSLTTHDIKISFIDTKEMPNTMELSDPKNSASCTFKADTDGCTIEKERENMVITNCYRLKLLAIFSKSQNYCKYVSLYLKADHPLVVNYQIDKVGFIVLIINRKTDASVKEGEDDEDSNLDLSKKKIYKKKEKAPVEKDDDEEEEEEEEGEEEEEEEEEYEGGDN